jgi:hypothetical protein
MTSQNPYSIGEAIETQTTDLDGASVTQNGKIVAIDGDDVTVAWDDGVRTTQHYSALQTA